MIFPMERLVCDSCGEGITDEFANGARECMAKFGWSVDDAGDLCPDCAVKSGRWLRAEVPAERLADERNGVRRMRFTTDGVNWCVGLWHFGRKVFVCGAFSEFKLSDCVAVCFVTQWGD